MLMVEREEERFFSPQLPSRKPRTLQKFSDALPAEPNSAHHLKVDRSGSGRNADRKTIKLTPSFSRFIQPDDGSSKQQFLSYVSFSA